MTFSFERSLGCKWPVRPEVGGEAREIGGLSEAGNELAVLAERIAVVVHRIGSDGKPKPQILT